MCIYICVYIYIHIHCTVCGIRSEYNLYSNMNTSYQCLATALCLVPQWFRWLLVCNVAGFLAPEPWLAVQESSLASRNIAANSLLPWPEKPSWHVCIQMRYKDPRVEGDDGSGNSEQCFHVGASKCTSPHSNCSMTSLMQGARLHQVDGPSVFCFAHEWCEAAADCTLDLFL